MAGAREGMRALRVVSARQLSQQASWPCARRFASSSAASQSSLAAIEESTSFSTPGPDENAVKAFKEARTSNKRDKQLPGGRYQFHPPKYNRGPLHPIQSPPSSDPTARDFVPGPFNLPRLKHTYDSTIAPDLMTLTYTHKPAGFEASESTKGQLREWDGSSPYHKNRPRRGPRGGQSGRLGLVEKEMSWHNLPEIAAVTVNSYAPEAADNKEYLDVARAVVQAITGEFPEVTRTRSNVIHWGVRKGQKTGAKVTLRGGAAYEFVDKLVTLVLPKIKEWPGVKGSSGDRAGNLGLGLDPEYMSYFPELEYNFDMYPPNLMPGCDIIIQTTGTSDRQGRLLLEALGFPFYGKVSY
ncbi:ribosomal L5P family protein [Cordyceps javanica]|uniref:Ribosomal L5P family protein n=1 Tax=Cordyceps javanica TaxID=43265 RepID=A0A545URT8_9HYPO|nr:ribosomal L5P family protein [Cordyceps javanica]TQW04052.1 ribosomal L5P family protein [Cordyceps javanica]